LARENAAMLASIRSALAEAGLDLEDSPGVRLVAGADRALSALRDSSAPQRADAAFIAQDP
jgi:hypothetical protein